MLTATIDLNGFNYHGYSQPCKERDNIEGQSAKLCRDLKCFEATLKDVQNSKYLGLLSEGSPDRLDSFLQNTRDRIDAHSIYPIRLLFLILWLINEPNSFVPQSIMSQLFGVMHCTMFIPFTLGDKQKTTATSAIKLLERQGLFLKLDDTPWKRLPIDQVWNVVSEIVSHVVQLCTSLIRCQTIDDVEAVKPPEQTFQTLMNNFSKSAHDAPPTDNGEKEQAKRKEQEKKDANLKSWLEVLGQGLGTDRHGALSQARIEGTGDWFLQKTTEWLSEGFVPVLWAKGPPGVGKSILASAFVDRMSAMIRETDKDKAIGAPVAGSNNATRPEANRKHLTGGHSSSFQPRALAYIYFAWDERENQNATQVYAQLLFQLFDRVKEVRDYLHPIKDAGESLKHKSDRGVWNAELPLTLRNIFSKLPRHVVLVMDALDEAPDDVYEDVKLLVREMAESSPKLLLLSRLHSEFQERQLKSGPNMGTLRIDSDKADMEKYIKDVLKRNTKVDGIVGERFKKSFQKDKDKDDFYKRICESVLDMSENTFIAAEFRVKDICSRRTIKAMEAASKDTGTDPGRIYQQAWERVQRDDRELAKKVIGWLTFSKRTLNVEELLEAVVIDPGVYDIDENEKLTPEMIVQVCNSLVVYDNQGYRQRFRLAHQTVQEYFSQHDDLKGMRQVVCYDCFTYVVFMIKTRHPVHQSDSQSPTDTEGDSDEDETWLSRRLRERDSWRHRDLSWDKRSDSSDEMSMLKPKRSTVSRSPYRSATYEYDSDVRVDMQDPNRSTSWLSDLSPWCNPEFILSSYIQEHALGHLTDVGVDDDLRHILEDFCKEQFSLRRRTSLVSKTDNTKTRSLNILHLGVFLGDQRTFRELRSHAMADIDAADDNGRTVLMWALHFNKADLARFLLDLGADPNVVDGDDCTAIRYATGCSDKDLIIRLMNQTNEKFLKSPDLLLSATFSSNTTFVEALLQQNIDVNRCSDMKGQNALHMSTILGYTDMFDTIIRNKADPSLRSARGRTALWYAIFHERQHHYTILMKLERQEKLDSGTSQILPSNLPDDAGVTPLHLAARANWSCNVIDELLNAGADPMAQDSDGTSPLHWVVRRWSNKPQDEDRIIKKVKKLAIDGEMVSRQVNGKTAIHYAAEHLGMEVVECLMDLCELEMSSTIDDEGTTLLKVAMDFGNLPLIKSLIEHPGMDLSNTIAVSNRNDLVRSCCESEDGLRDFEMLTDTETWFLQSSTSGEPYRNAYGDTALHSAVIGISTVQVQKILAMPGFSVQDRNVYGETALHITARDGNPRIAHKFAKILLDECDDPNVGTLLTNGGKSALDFALERGLELLIAILVDPSYNACVGVAWPLYSQWIRAWKAMPWFNHLTHVIEKSQGMDQTVPPDPATQWITERSVRQEDVRVTEDTEERDYLSIQIPDCHEVHRVVFRIVSHDQGWSNNNEVNGRTKGTYFGSRTWFEAGILTNGVVDSYRPVVQRNVHADDTLRQHTVIWDIGDTSPGVQDWLRCLKSGDQIQLFPKAFQAAWRNYVEEAEINIWCI